MNNVFTIDPKGIEENDVEYAASKFLDRMQRKLDILNNISQDYYKKKRLESPYCYQLIRQLHCYCITQVFLEPQEPKKEDCTNSDLYRFTNVTIEYFQDNGKENFIFTQTPLEAQTKIEETIDVMIGRERDCYYALENP